MATPSSNEQVQRALKKSNIVSTHIYELLPDVIRNADPLDALKGIFGAVQEEYDRYKDCIEEMLVLVDPKGINNKFILEGNPTFFHPEQFLPSSGTTLIGENTIYLNGNPAGSDLDDIYNGFGVYVWQGPGVGQYRRITDYDGTTKQAQVDASFTVALTTLSIFALCYPDRIYLPTEVVGDPLTQLGTLLSDQSAALNPLNEVILPNLLYISESPEAYTDWTIEFLEGTANQREKFKITSYSGDGSPTPRLATVVPQMENAPAIGDWFKLVPPKADQVSTTQNFYKDRYIRILSSTNDESNNYQIQIQTRRILRSEYDSSVSPAKHVCYVADDVTGEGERWEFPPDPDNYFGIVNHFVSLAYLAKQIGWRLDSLDPEELQREQIRQAYSFYKLKGTRRSIELICESFGLAAFVEERSSNYTSPPDPVGVGPEYCEPVHLEDKWNQIQPIVQTGRGEDDVPCEWQSPPVQNTVRIPDSDIRIFLSRISPKASFDPTILQRILDKVEDVRPIHVEIVLVGFFQPQNEFVDVDDELEFEGTFTYEAGIAVSEGFAGTPTGTVIVPLASEDAAVDSFLLITRPGHYDDGPDENGVNAGVDARYDGPSGSDRNLRYDTGLTLFEG